MVFLTPCIRAIALACAVIAAGSVSLAQSSKPFEGGWTLDLDASELRVMSIKKEKIAEISPFRVFQGRIGESGETEVTISLDSIDTGIDLRNVRMRFLFFETFQFPEARLTTVIDPAMLEGLESARAMAINLPYTLEIRGVEAERTDRVQVVLLDRDTVVVSSAEPIPIQLAGFDLESGRQKLQEAALVDIVPLGTVSFRFMFKRNVDTAVALAETQPVREAAASTAIEPVGELDRSGCTGRFEILSRTGSIYFRPGSAQLDAESGPLLDVLNDVVTRCPSLDIEIAGHTDSDGSAAANQRLSEARAASVLAYLTDRGVAPRRLVAVGYGETKPLYPNDSPQNKARNRRIEFSVLR